MRRTQAAITRSMLLALILLAPVQAYAARSDTEARPPIGGVRPPFIANWGQLDARVAYYAPAYDGTLFVTRQGQLVYSLPPKTPGAGWTVTETLVGGRPRPAAQDPSAIGVSYFIGADPALWRGKAPAYEQVGLGEVWPGIAVALWARGQGIEKVFTVSPGASVDRIRIRVSGARAFSVNSKGALVANTGLGDIAFTAPVAYQERDGVRRAVPVAYRSDGQHYGFTVGAYDPRLPLVIDPRLQSTYLGGSGDDSGAAIGIHPTTGDVYVAGWTTSTNFPGTTGGAQPANAGNRDAFVARLSSDLTTLIRVTYLGGSGDDQANALAIHQTTGNIYVAGSTTSTNFPGTAGGAQPASSGSGDAFVARLSSDLGTLVQATYFGGSNTDTAAALAIHATTGDVYIGGSASTGPGCGSSTGVVARLNSSLTALLQSGTVGAGQIQALKIHPGTGEVLVAGFDASFAADAPAAADLPAGRFLSCPVRAFVKRLNGGSLAVAGSITFSSNQLFGGFASANALAIDPVSGDVYAGGAGDAGSIPGTVGGAQATCTGVCAFVARLTSSLTLVQATFLGNSENAGRGVSGVAIHPTTGNVYVAGTTNDPDFPGTTGGIQPDLGGDQDAFLARLTSSLAALVQATYLGGVGTDIAFALAIPANGDVYLTGSTKPIIFPFADFPGTAGGAQPSAGGAADAFVARVNPTLAQADPPVGADLTVNKTHAGNFIKSQPGSVYTITVSNVGTAATSGTVTVTDTLPAALFATALAGTGWSCTLGTLTCTRADALGAGQTYPTIQLTVTASSSGPPSVVNTATVSGGADVNPANNTATDPTSLVSYFADVAPDNPFSPWIDALFLSSITGGCSTSPPRFCPQDPVTRNEMAVFLERGIHGAGFTPPPATGIFADVNPTSPFAPFIEQLYNDGITGGCSTSPLQYCGFDDVTREQMAVFLLRAKHGPGFTPPPATGIFADVPPADPYAPWIEQLFNEGITGGCGVSPARYCPDEDVTREEMAVFLVRTFGLPIPP